MISRACWNPRNISMPKQNIYKSQSSYITKWLCFMLKSRARVQGHYFLIYLKSSSQRYSMKVAATHDFQQCGILTSVDSNKIVQPPFKLRNSKRCSVSSLRVIDYSRD